jgi:predicted neuraminidase
MQLRTTILTARTLGQSWAGIPGIEVTPRGRLFVVCFSGGSKEPDPVNIVYLTFSDGGGSTFGLPVAMAGPSDGARAFDPTLWRDPLGRLWLIFNRGNKDAADHGVYARLCADPDAAEPVWSEERRLDLAVPYAFRMNKPTVLASGEWLLPVTHAKQPIHEWFAGDAQLQGVGISRDQGQTWTLHGAVAAPPWALENMVVERRDGSVWMLIRTGSGELWESVSTDGGRTWNEGHPSGIKNPGSRFFIRRLASGKLLLLNHVGYAETGKPFTGRSHLTAQISTDDGKSWTPGLLLDGRDGVSYPDAAEAPDGSIFAIYDRDRGGTGEILLARFTEADALAGHDVSKKAQTWTDTGRLLPADWDPKAAGDRVLARLIKVTPPEVKGAHDSDLVIVDGKAYIVYEANDRQPGEAPDWPFVYCALSVVDVASGRVEQTLTFAVSETRYDNETLPVGACFVPHLLRKDARTIRCFFASEDFRAGHEAQTWYRDYELTRGAFDGCIHRAEIETDQGIFPMQPRAFHQHAVAKGFRGEPTQHGLYLVDGFKRFDGRVHAVLNNFPGGQLAWAVLNPALDRFTVLGDFFLPHEAKLTEAAVNRLPDGSWLAISRQENRDQNYMFAASPDGRTWTPHEYRLHVVNGTNSKPVFECFGGIYYLGWNEATQVNGAYRSVFNLDVSRDGIRWERKYRFETDKSFQYPTLREYEGAIYLTVTQGDYSASRKERIMFGPLTGRAH